MDLCCNNYIELMDIWPKIKTTIQKLDREKTQLQQDCFKHKNSENVDY